MGKTTLAAAALVGTLAMAAPANAVVIHDDHRPCVTFAEWGRLEVGASRHAIYELLDGSGEPGLSANLRQWKICRDTFNDPSKYGTVVVWFKHGKMYAAYWIQLNPHHG